MDSIHDLYSNYFSQQITEKFLYLIKLGAGLTDLGFLLRPAWTDDKGQNLLVKCF